jgi:hypothetical protein
LEQILTHVGKSTDRVLEQIIWLGSQDDGRISIFGPFLGRSLLELSATALIARLDPLRVLFLREIQPRFRSDGVDERDSVSATSFT